MTLSRYESDCLQDYGYLPDLEEGDPEFESLAASPEGKGWEPLKNSGDSRDATPEPPAYLDPHFILRNRARVQIYLATGEITWPRVAA